MMKPCKKIAAFFLAICLVLAACGAGDPGKFASQQSFEYHFFPEEYEEEYREYEKTISLEENTESRLTQPQPLALPSP